MKFVLYGTEEDRAEIARSIASLPDLNYRNIGITDRSDYDGFIAALKESPPECIVITMNGADGMEGVIAAKNLYREVPVLWFSDDGGFGAQSYRLGCAYFHEKPVSPQVLSAAIAKCI